MTEYASQETIEVMTERFRRRDGHLSLIGIRSKIDQVFLMRTVLNRRASSDPPVGTGPANPAPENFQPE